MALAAAASHRTAARGNPCSSSRGSRGSSSTTHVFSSGRQQQQPRVVTKASASAHAPPQQQQQGQAAGQAPQLSTATAIVNVGGVRQMLQEGQLGTCPKRCLEHQPQPQQQQQGQATGQAPTATPSTFVLRDVLGLRSGGVFECRRPYLRGSCVTVEVLEEWSNGGAAAAAAGSASAATQPGPASPDATMAIYLVKSIQLGTGAAATQ